MDMKSFYLKCYLPMLIPCLLTVFLGGYLVSLFSHNGWFYLVIKACIVSMVYLAAYFLFAMNKERKRALFQKLKLKRS